MKKPRRKPATPRVSSAQIAELRARLAEADETLRAIRNGEVDTVAVAGEQGRRVFTLEGAERAYRVLIESMNEGAVMLTPDRTILYANQCFARMVKRPLEQVPGGSFARFLSAEHLALLRQTIRRLAVDGSKIQVFLIAADGTQMPVQISLRPVETLHDEGAAIGMVVSDLTEVHRSHEMLRAFARRAVQAQEEERRRVALDLHDHITQLLCAISFESQALVGRLPKRDPAARKAAVKLNEMLGQAGEEVERISRNLRPNLLDQMGLVAVLRAVTKEFAQRTGIPVEVSCEPLPVPLIADTELTLYRILQEALTNVEKHARPKKVSVSLSEDSTHVQLIVSDDGIGFDPDHSRHVTATRAGLGLLSMRERAMYVSGAFAVKSARDSGTTVEVRIPLGPATPSETV